MTTKQKEYFEIRYDKRITDYKRLSDEERIPEIVARERYKRIDDYICKKIGVSIKVLEEIKEYFKDYHALYSKYYNENREDLFKHPEQFLKWFKDEGSRCGYCAITQTELHDIVEKRKGKLTINGLPKRSKGTLEIEKKDSNGKYTFSNVILACPLCNNAKSNLISEGDWKNFFVDSMRNYYEKILGKKLEFEPTK